MSLNQFKQFVKFTDQNSEINTQVWLYTRVSSKDQEMNKSLQNQKEYGYKYAQENRFTITNTFGQTYESASGDFSRAEFTKLINEVRKAKKKPFAILIYTLSRFSRSGGSGIALAYELIEGLGVNLIEVSSGKSTITKEGRLEIYSGLIKASQENLDRLKVTIPGMKKLLQNGDWLGVVPKGYDQYGPRVKDHKFYNPVQKVIINEEGELLKRAWKWKLQGEQDHVIISKLRELGLTISRQSLSEMWRKPFYCGIICNKMLGGEVIRGNWEGMVTEQEFWIVQEILKPNNQGYKQEKANPERPLNAFIHCAECGNKLVGYEVKKKNLHYYKCQTCKGVSINANTTQRAKAGGAHDLFKELLKEYQLSPELSNLFKQQLKLTYEALNKSGREEGAILSEQLEKLEIDLKSLKRKYAIDSDIDKEVYLEMKVELESKILGLKEKVQKSESSISNLGNYIDVSEKIVRNLSNYWASGKYEVKKKVQELVFPEGLSLDVKKRTYLTKRVNMIFQLSHSISKTKDSKKTNGNRDFLLPSSLVAGARLELTTFGL